MAPAPLATPASATPDSYAAACKAWRHDFDSYLRLARQGASTARLRAAAAAVHAAALRKGRLARALEDAAG